MTNPESIIPTRNAEIPERWRKCYEECKRQNPVMLSEPMRMIEEIAALEQELEHRREVDRKLKERADSQREWVYSNYPECFVDQKHCEDVSIERGYWHYGSMVALTDVINLIERRTR